MAAPYGRIVPSQPCRSLVSVTLIVWMMMIVLVYVKATSANSLKKCGSKWLRGSSEW